MPSSSSTGMMLMKQKVKSILENLFNVHREIETSLQCKNLDFSGESILIESLLPRRIFIPNKLLEKNSRGELFTPVYCHFKEIILLLEKGNIINQVHTTLIKNHFGGSIKLRDDQLRLGYKELKNF